ncbi:phage terminase large subunit [Luteimonas sp. A1P009]|uniref:Phage terminase large subunit n=2 Tax=Luteimonas fraxinea TaxID=2901869 RepID=A0ABS8UBT2_9GAMM|nr:phage terminase large subunit [Luteimonas fraxinea]
MVALPTMAEIRAEKARREQERARERLARDIEGTRERCTTLAGFIREAWPVLEPSQPYVHGWHIDVLCEHLEAVTDGMITRLLINIPPGTMKSLVSSVFWPAWEWGPRGLPGMRYLTTSYAEKFVKRDTRRMRDLVQSEWYRTLWPEIGLKRAGEMSFENTRMGNREGVPFQSLTGGRGDRVIIDDPHSTETAESPAERATTTRIFRESVPTRLNNPATSAIIVIMQRLHADDVSGQIVKLGLGYDHLMLPMEFEPDRRSSTSIGFSDPRSAEGELLFPERFPRAVVERDKKILGSYATAGQLQQRPAPREGGMFKRAWFDIVDAAPARARRVRRWDFAATDPRDPKTKSGDPDWTVGLLLAEAGGVYYIEHVTRDRVSPAGVTRMLRTTAEQDGKGIPVRIPQDPGAAGKSTAAAQIQLLAGWDVRASAETGSKAVRAAPVSAQAEAGNIKLIRGPWNEAFLEEVSMFPNAAHDDQVDGLSGAFAELVTGSTYDLQGAL